MLKSTILGLLAVGIQKVHAQALAYDQCIFSSAPLTSQSCPGTFTPITASAAFAALNPGWNLGNTLDATPTEGSWNNPPVQPETFAQIRAKGFNSVRIPVTWGYHFIDSSPTWNINTTWLDRVETVVDEALSHDFYVILNAHHDSWVWVDFTATNVNLTQVEERFSRLWTQIGSRFACKSSKLLFEPLNEPSGSTAAHGTELNKLNDLFLTAINNAGGFNPLRVVSLSGLGMDLAKTSQFFSRGTLYPSQPWGLQVHYYAPYDFIFGAWGKTIWGSDADKASLVQDFTLFKGNFTNIPTFIGEWSASPSNTETAGRWKYFDFFLRTAKSFNYSTLLWDNGNDEFNRSVNSWKDPVAMNLLFTAVKGENNTLADSTVDPAAASQFSSAYLFHKVGDAVVDQSATYLLNGNSLRDIKTSSGRKLNKQDYAFSAAGNLTLSSSYLSTLFSPSSAAGTKETLTLTFSSGAPLTLSIIQYTTPIISQTTFNLTTLSTANDLHVPIQYQGLPEIAAVKAIVNDSNFYNDLSGSEKLKRLIWMVMFIGVNAPPLETFTLMLQALHVGRQATTCMGFATSLLGPLKVIPCFRDFTFTSPLFFHSAKPQSIDPIHRTHSLFVIKMKSTVITGHYFSFYASLASCTVPLYIQNNTVSLNTTSTSSTIWADIRNPAISCDFSVDSFVAVRLEIYIEEREGTNITQSINTTCQPHIISLQALQQPLAAPTLRLNAAERLSNCVIKVLYETYYCSSFQDSSVGSLAALWVDIGHNLPRDPNGSYPPEPPINIDNNGSSYPSFLPMMTDACEFDLKNLTLGTCCTSPSTLSKQYVRCVAQKESSEVRDCVVNTAVKSDWLPPGIFLYGGGQTCEGTKAIITFAAAAVLVDALGLVARIIINKIRHKDLVPQRNFSLVSIFINLGVQIAKPFLTALLLESMGIPSSKLSSFALFLMYPRPSCIIAFVSLFVRKWRGYAFQLIFADLILNLLCFGMTELKGILTYPVNPTNPLLPAHSLYMYQKGFMVSIGTGYAVYALLMGFTGLGALDLLAGIFSKEKNYEYSVFRSVAILWILLITFIVALPILAFAEMLVKIVNFFRKKDKGKRDLNRLEKSSPRHGTSWMSKELAKVFGHDNKNNEDNDDSVNPTGSSEWVWFAAIILLAAAIVSAVGNWMTTIELYGMAGDAWCPAELDSLALIQVGMPLLGHLLDMAFLAIS
ncbi:hypothetical protein G7Y89_g13512 [Cudoniella acicularis]|uniref:Glycoside hydrolase family 5 domain-containing protein n=1 Tax=Cudoniella acicularis TaxID=354080 RepID=A0A8H4VYL8_9HELO|nr:hypothetical protein G7Y89_g13512 [Cudoniella acicularis]